MEAAGEHLSLSFGLAGAMPDRPIYDSPKPSTSTVCELEVRPSCSGNQCFRDEVGWLSGVCLSSFSLVGRCLRKVIQEECAIILIAPVWPAQARFPILLKCLVEYPVLLPRHRLLLTDPFNRLHPLIQKGQLQLAAWKVSGNVTQQKAFQVGLPNSFWQGGARPPIQLTSHRGSG